MSYSSPFASPPLITRSEAGNGALRLSSSGAFVSDLDPALRSFRRRYCTVSGLDCPRPQYILNPLHHPPPDPDRLLSISGHSYIYIL